jgi:MFS transporter, TsgA protein
MRIDVLRTTTDRRIGATTVAVATYVVVAGIFTQSGVILRPAAAYFSTSLAQTATLFFYANAANLAGILVSPMVFKGLPVRQVLVGGYAMMLAGVTIVLATHVFLWACFALAAIGFGLGLGLSSGAVIITKLYGDRERAIAFLSTDCAFSASGFVFPAAAAFLIAAHRPWQSGYAVVAALATITMIAAFVIRFPETRGTPVVATAPVVGIRRHDVTVIALLAAGIALFFTGETMFVIWAPAVLQKTLNVPALQAGTIISCLYGPSSVGLLVTAVVLKRVPPRAILLFAVTTGALLTFALATITNAHTFFLVTMALGFATTCMFTLMLSAGSEQIPKAPPIFITTLVLCSGIGSVGSPMLSAEIVKRAGLHASLWGVFCCYAGTMAVVVVVLVLQRGQKVERDFTGIKSNQVSENSMREIPSASSYTATRIWQNHVARNVPIVQ